MKAADTSGIKWDDYFEYDENTPVLFKMENTSRQYQKS